MTFNIQKTYSRCLIYTLNSTDVNQDKVKLQAACK